MSLGRRKSRLEDASAWIFNRMAEVYPARPAYPTALVEALSALAAPGARVADIGAGIGHLALPLAERGFEVVAVEPAQAMLGRLSEQASERGLGVQALHATAEALPLPDQSADLVIVSDALHFLDKELASAEIARVLSKRGALAVITSEFGETPFMRAVTQVMEASAPRRPRAVADAIAQLATLARVRPLSVQRFEDATPVDPGRLEAILRSISFIGPAMNPERFAAFREKIHALVEPPVWARSFTLHAGRRGRRARVATSISGSAAGEGR